MKKVLVLIICLSLCFGISLEALAAENYGASRTEDLVDKNTGMIRKISWSDEFTGDTLSENIWNYDVGDIGWGSRGLYTVRKENVKLNNGLLDIVSQIQFDDNGLVKTNSEYSGSINCKGNFDFKYGEIDIRAKMAPGTGVGSESFLLGKDKVWPKCGEVDLFQYSNNTTLLTQAVHTPSIDNTDSITNDNIWQRTLDSSKFHIFKMRWFDKKIDLYVDNLFVGTYNPADFSSYSDPSKDSKAWPFNQPMYICLRGSIDWRIAGDRTRYGWTLVKENEEYSDYETHTYVDYVRVYKFDYDNTIKNQIKSKPKLYSASKKKKSKKLTIKLFNSGWSNGFEFNIYKTKKNNKILVKTKYEGLKGRFIIKNKKLKNRKTLYVRARSYKYCYNVKYYSKWSKPLKVKIKK